MLFKVIFSGGAIIEGADVRTAYTMAAHDRREMCYRGYGLEGYTLYDRNGDVLMNVPAGDAVSFEDADPSVRLYNAVMSRLCGWGLVSAKDTISMMQMRAFATNGCLRRMPGVGLKTYAELFYLVRKYTGWGPGIAQSLVDCGYDPERVYTTMRAMG